MERSEKYCWVAAAALISAFGLQSTLASLRKSPTSDEPPHIAAGLSYVQTRTFRANPQHPPLMKELSGASLMLGGVRPQYAMELQDYATHPGQPEWDIGYRIIAQNGIQRVMFRARLPMITIAALLGVFLYVWGRRIAGQIAGLSALFLYAFDPNILAHSYLVTTDIGCAAFSVLFLFTLWNYVQRPSWVGRVLCGLALGAALCAKFSALVLVPIAAALLAAAALLPSMAFAEYPTRLRRLLACGLDLVAMSMIAIVAIQAVYLFSPDPLLYLKGLKQVNADHIADYPGIIAGQLVVHSRSYFAIAYLLKEPLAGIILFVIGAVALVRTRRVTLLDKLFLIVPAAGLFAVYSFFADPFGIRYIIPVLVFLYLIAGLGLASLLQMKQAWAWITAGVLAAWILVTAVGVYPDHLAYFNEAACLQDPGKIGFDGGSRCGPMWLDDSNVDWGQGLAELKTWLDRNAQGRTVRLRYFGSFPPEFYGIAYQKLSDTELALPDPPPGLVVVSSHIIARVPALVDEIGLTAGSWLRDHAPKAIIGHSLYVYDFPETQSASLRP
jgi:hypothetical protein